MIITERSLSVKVDFRHTESLRTTELLAAARSGSAAAFAELMAMYGQRVYGKLLMITRNREDAEDALQDAFLRAYKKLHTFEERASFYTWLTKIAINSALMILRRRRNRSEVSFDHLNETAEDFPGLEFKDTGPTPEHVCLHRQRYAQMLGSIEKLQPRLRQVVELRMRGISSIREIANALQISEAAVKSRLSRARMRLAPARSVRSSHVNAWEHREKTWVAKGDKTIGLEDQRRGST